MKDKIILLYKITEVEKAVIRQKYQDKYSVIDKSNCFTDILAIPAMMIVLNPQEITDAEYRQMNEVFHWDYDTMIMFSEKPSTAVKLHFSYYVADSLELITGSFQEINENIAMVEGYEHAIIDSEALLKEIKSTIMPDDSLSTANKTAHILNRLLIYRQLLDVVDHLQKNIPPREKVAFRNEIMNVLLAMKLAYRLIEVEDIRPFDNELSEDSDWVFYLAENIRNHRENYLKNGNHLYMPKNK